VLGRRQDLLSLLGPLPSDLRQVPVLRVDVFAGFDAAEDLPRQTRIEITGENGMHGVPNAPT
jgi:hypothetical protein